MSFESTLILASITGIIVHLGLFNRGEWHMKAPHVVVGHVLLITVSLLGASRERTASQLLPHLICFSAAYLGSLFFSILVYRLSPLHRLHHFPGPRLAAASKLWHVWQCRDSRNHEVMRNLYHEYGDFVRTGEFFLPADRGAYP